MPSYIQPRVSDINSRSEVKTTKVIAYNGGEFECTPVVVSNMYNCGTIAMAKELNKFNIPVALHKFYDVKTLQSLGNEFFERNFYTMGFDYDKLKETGLNPKLICLDIANGYMTKFHDFVKQIKDEYPNSFIMAGNVCTAQGANAIIAAGADCVKIGIGTGAHCITYNMTGIGLPQHRTIDEIKNNGIADISMCADGGVKEVKDICLNLVRGADLVMVGTMFCGFDENEGNWSFIPDFSQRNYRKNRLQVYGMSSREAQETHYGIMEDYRAAEGLCSWIDGKGPVVNLAKDILGGLRSCCSYMGIREVGEMDKGQIIEV